MGNRKRLVRSVFRTAAIAGGVAVGAYGASVLAAWFRYGRPRQPSARDEDSLLDRYMPAYDVVERHRVLVAAPPPITFWAACELDLRRSPLVAAIFSARERLLRSTPSASREPRALISELKTSGWGVLAEIPEREIVMGAVTRPWEANVIFRALPPREFAAFDDAGYVKIAWTLRADAAGAGASICRTETRAVATDSTARRRFRRYWAWFSPGIVLIRREALRMIKWDAEHRFRDQRAVPRDRFDLVSSGDLDSEC